MRKNDVIHRLVTIGIRPKPAAKGRGMVRSMSSLVEQVSLLERVERKNIELAKACGYYLDEGKETIAVYDEVKMELSMNQYDENKSQSHEENTEKIIDDLVTGVDNISISYPNIDTSSEKYNELIHHDLIVQEILTLINGCQSLDHSNIHIHECFKSGFTYREYCELKFKSKMN
jgi:hypothetical protein